MNNNKITYTDEELETINYIENENPKSISNIKQEMINYQKIAKEQYGKRKAISIRLLEYDIKKLKAKSKAEGIPYQTLISGAIHKYANSY